MPINAMYDALKRDARQCCPFRIGDTVQSKQTGTQGRVTDIIARHTVRVQWARWHRECEANTSKLRHPLFTTGAPKVIPLIKDSPHAGTYASAWRRAKELAQTAPNTQVRWMGWNQSAEKVYRDFLATLETRINARASLPECRGRKDSERYMTDCYRDRRALADHFKSHVIVHSLNTAECRRRFANLIEPYED